MRNLLFLTMLAGLLSTSAVAENHYRLESPDGNLSVSINIDHHITYAVYDKGEAVILPSVIAMNLGSKVLGSSPAVKNASTHEVNKSITPLYGKFSKLSEHYRELKITFKGNYAVVFRAYDQGIAYRFMTSIKDSIKVMSETAQFNLAGRPGAILPVAHNLTSWELPYTSYSSVSLVPNGDTVVLPALFSFEKLHIKVVLAESDLMNYPGMFIRVDHSNVHGFWAGYPAKTAMGSWGNFVSVVKKRAPYIAATKGTRSFPWRVAIITDDDRELLSNELIYKLASPSRLHDAAWIKPGKAAWEWWSDAMLPGADIPSGMDNRNTALYKYYVDFAAKYNLEYVLIDAGWSNIFHLSKVNPKIDIREVISYAKKKKVGVFLWCVAST
ncbi:MAG TPA: glycoside hydrolase family 97 N-terminal domain-containing protein, partial [Chitinophagaceae bacterium]|nr:glycoside hydrolase family 97 N-terminal domain-containing protein [Chitinophagaceae bacterium]